MVQRLLKGIVWGCLLLIPFLSPHMYTHTLFRVAIPDNTFVLNDFHAVVLFLIDYPLLIGLVTTLILLSIDKNWRQHLYTTSRKILRTDGAYWWVLLIGWTCLSSLWAASALLSLYYAVHLLIGLLMALLIAQWVANGGRRWLLWALLVAGVLHSGVAIAQALHGGSLGLTWLGEFQRSQSNPYGFGAQDIRAYGFSLHPNNLGGFLMIVVISGLVLLHDVSGRERFAAAILMGVVMLGLLATASRTAFLALVLVVPVLGYGYKPRFSRRWLLVISLLIVVMIASGLLGNFWGRLTEVANTRAGFLERITYAYRDTVGYIEAHPLHGIGGYNLMLTMARDWGGSPILLLPAHNAYIYVWAELGIVGLFLFSMALLSIVAYTHPRNTAPIFILSCAMLAVCISMLFDFYFWGDLRSTMMIFWLLGLWWGSALPQD